MNKTHTIGRIFITSLFVTSFLCAASSAFAMDAWDTVTPPAAAGQTFRTVLSVADTVYVGTSVTVHKSINRGSSWTAQSGLPNSAVNALAIGWAVNSSGTYEVAAGTPVYAATNAGVYKSTLGANAWTGAGLSGIAISDIQVDQSLAVQGVISTLYAATAGGVYRSDDAGGTWTLVNVGMEGKSVKKIVTDFALGNIYALTTENTVYISPLHSVSTANESWSLVYTGATTLNDISLLNGVGGITWISSNTGVLKDDGTNSWKGKNIGLPSGSILAVSSDYLDSNIAFSAHATAGVFRTTNEALAALPNAQWLPLNNNIPSLAILDVVTNPMNELLVYAISLNGVYRMEMSSPYVDLTPPGTVTDLAVSTSTSATATLTWTRPGGDGAYGIPKSYDVRFSTSSILTENDWANATKAVGAPSPLASLPATEVFMIQPLQANTKHYFALKSIDGSGNISFLSNVVSAGVNAPTPDTVPPTITAFAIASTSTTLSVPVTIFHATDDIGVTGYLITESATPPTAGVAGWSSTPPTTKTLSSPGAKIVYGWAKDAAGNVSSPANAAVTISTPGTTTVSLTVTANATAVSGTIIVSASATDPAGIAGVQFKLDNVNLGAEDTTSPYSISWTTTGTTNGTHTLVAVARNSTGNVATSAFVSVAVNNTTADTQVPTTPTGLTATAVSSSDINLSWSASTDNVAVTGYKVYRGGTQIATTTSGTTYSNTGLTSSTLYSYTVAAYDAAGNTSDKSVAATATTQATAVDTTAPTTPTGLTAMAISSSGINLAWNASTDNVGVTGYRVMRGPTAGSLTQVGTSTAVTYTDTVLSPLTTYFYAVRAVDAVGNLSSVSAQSSTTTLPSVPSGLAGSAGSTNQINVSWSASTERIAGFELFRGGALITTTSSSTLSYADTGLSSGTPYTYTLRTYVASGVRSLQTGWVIITTPSPAPVGGGGGGGGGTAWIYGCTDKSAVNYNPTANVTNNTCVYSSGVVLGASTTGATVDVSATFRTAETVTLSRNLKFGMKGDDVKALQIFLAKDPSVYPDGTASGFFGPLTMNAVIRFQEKYRAELLTPNGLTRGTGFVGLSTREKVNALMGAGVVTTPVTPPTVTANGPLSRNLKFGMKGDDVKALQIFLAKDPSVYPDGTASGFFGPLTMNAVIRFQEKYRAELLTPNGLTRGTGFVGLSTREKVNSLL